MSICQAKTTLQFLGQLSSYALAVSEGNADGHLSVTAPTLGSARSIIAVKQSEVTQSLTEEVFIQYNLAGRYLRNGEMLYYHYRKEEQAELGARDVHMPQMLTQLMAAGYQWIVHVDGWEHLAKWNKLTNLRRYFPRAERVLMDETK